MTEPTERAGGVQGTVAGWKLVPVGHDASMISDEMVAFMAHEGIALDEYDWRELWGLMLAATPEPAAFVADHIQRREDEILATLEVERARGTPDETGDVTFASGAYDRLRSSIKGNS